MRVSLKEKDFGIENQLPPFDICQTFRRHQEVKTKNGFRLMKCWTNQQTSIQDGLLGEGGRDGLVEKVNGFLSKRGMQVIKFIILQYCHIAFVVKKVAILSTQ